MKAVVVQIATGSTRLVTWMTRQQVFNIAIHMIDRITERVNTGKAIFSPPLTASWFFGISAGVKQNAGQFPRLGRVAIERRPEAASQAVILGRFPAQIRALSTPEIPVGDENQENRTANPFICVEAECCRTIQAV